MGQAKQNEMTRRCIDAVAMFVAVNGCGYRVARESVKRESIAGPAVWDRVDAHFKALPAEAWVAA